MGSRERVTSPTTTVTIAMTIATIGRRMKNWAIFALLLSCLLRRRRCRQRLNGGALPHFLQTLHHDALARFQPLFDYPVTAKSLTDRDATLGNLVCVIHHPDKIFALQFLDCPLRNKERAGAILNFEPRLRVLAWPEDVARVWEKCADPNRAGFWIHLPICRKEAAFVGMHLAIGADEFANRFALVEGLHKHGRKVLRRGKVLEAIWARARRRSRRSCPRCRTTERCCSCSGVGTATMLIAPEITD